MVSDWVYAERWERKRQWYANHGILEASPANSAGDPAGLLVWSADDDRGGFDAHAVARPMDELFT